MHVAVLLPALQVVLADRREQARDLCRGYVRGVEIGVDPEVVREVANDPPRRGVEWDRRVAVALGSERLIIDGLEDDPAAFASGSDGGPHSYVKLRVRGV